MNLSRSNLSSLRARDRSCQYKNRARGCEDIHKIPRGQYLEHSGRFLATAVGMLVFNGPESGQQSLGDTMPQDRHTLERVLALLEPRGLACLFGSRISQIVGYHPLSLGSSGSAGSQRSTREPDTSKR